MGVLMKGALLLVGVLLFGVAWEASALIFVCLFVPPLLKAGKRRGGGKAPRIGTMKWVGAALLGVGGVAIASGGRLSPVVLGLAGAAFLALPPRLLSAGGASPVRGSMLLRRGPLPFRWFAVAELKISTRDPARALSGVEGRLLVRHSPDLRVFSLVETWALTPQRGVHGAVAGLRRVARQVAPMGVYVLPLGSAEASEVCRLPPRRGRGAPLRGDGRGGAALLVEAHGGTVAAYELFAGDGRPGSALDAPERRPRREVYLAELLGASFESWSPRTDDLTSFLASAAATTGEGFGERVKEVSGEGDVVSAAAVGGTRVSLARDQLKAVLEVYR